MVMSVLTIQYSSTAVPILYLHRAIAHRCMAEHSHSLLKLLIRHRHHVLFKSRRQVKRERQHQRFPVM